MVVISTFKWETLKYRGKIPRADIIVMIAVTLITIFTDLATAVIVGVILSALAFAWEKGTEAAAKEVINDDGSKTYKLNGSIFFGSVRSEEHTSELQSRGHLVCRLLLEKNALLSGS